jgi:hypothetical protein
MDMAAMGLKNSLVVGDDDGVRVLLMMPRTTLEAPK